MPALPYFPLYPKDIFTDDRMMDLKGEEVGILLVFLCKVWINENQLKDDDAKISRILRVPRKKWEKLKERLLESGLLEIDYAGYLTNRRLTHEFEESKVKSANGLKAVRIKNDKINAAKEIKSKTSNNYDGMFD